MNGDHRLVIEILLGLLITVAGGYFGFVVNSMKSNIKDLWKKSGAMDRDQSEKWILAAKEYWTKMEQAQFRNEILEQLDKINVKLDRLIERGGN